MFFIFNIKKRDRQVVYQLFFRNFNRDDPIMVNLFLFFPDLNGKIESIALYGSNLQGHYNAMHRSMMAFGMRITSISMEYGESDFLDIYIDY